MAIHNRNFGKFGASIPCDIDGYIPQRGDSPFAGSWDHGSQLTHDAAGNLTEYGEWWRDEGFGELVERAEAAMIEADRALDQWRGETATATADASDDADDNADTVLEVTTNNEYIREHVLDLSWIQDDREHEVADDYRHTLGMLLRDAGYDVETPGGQRNGLHGFSGAHYEHRVGAIGTFHELTAVQVAELDAIHEQALKAARFNHDRQIVCNLIDELAPVSPEQVADAAYAILRDSGLEAALAEVRRAKAFDETKGHGN